MDGVTHLTDDVHVHCKKEGLTMRTFEMRMPKLISATTSQMNVRMKDNPITQGQNGETMIFVLCARVA